MTSKVSLPWLDEPVPIDEAVEALGRVSQDDAERVDRLERRIESGEGGDGASTAEDVDEVDDIDEEVETLSRAVDDASEEQRDLQERVEAVERRLEALEDPSMVECPNCGSSDGPFKASIAAAILAQEGELNDAIAGKLNESSHLCLECDQPFRVEPEGT